MKLQKEKQEFLLIQTLLEKAQSTSSQAAGEDDLFGRSIGESLQRLPPRIRTRTKIRIMQVIETAEQEAENLAMQTNPVLNPNPVNVNTNMYCPMQGFNYPANQ